MCQVVNQQVIRVADQLNYLPIYLPYYLLDSQVASLHVNPPVCPLASHLDQVVSRQGSRLVNLPEIPAANPQFSQLDSPAMLQRSPLDSQPDNLQLCPHFSRLFVLLTNLPAGQLECHQVSHPGSQVTIQLRNRRDSHQIPQPDILHSPLGGHLHNRLVFHLHNPQGGHLVNQVDNL